MYQGRTGKVVARNITKAKPILVHDGSGRNSSISQLAITRFFFFPLELQPNVFCFSPELLTYFFQLSPDLKQRSKILETYGILVVSGGLSFRNEMKEKVSF